jgi:transcriptional regulator with XRE-family HTH domain
MPNDDYNHLKEWLLPKIEKMGLSVEKFSRLAKISRASVYYWFGDVTRPDDQTMARVCQVVGAPLEEGLRQYTPKPEGRRPGYQPGPRTVATHQRRSRK